MSHGGDDGLPEEHEEHVNHEAWVIPYADLLTLLMAMFIALFAMSSVDVDKFKELAIGFNEALGGGDLDSGIGGAAKDASPAFGEGAGSGPFEGGELKPGDAPSNAQLVQMLSALTQKSAFESQKQRERATLDDVRKAIEDEATKEGLGGNLRLQLRNDGLAITLVTDKVLFASGRADLQAQGLTLLEVVEKALQRLPNDILIIGHTDSDPISTPFPSNMHLSSARAIAVFEYFKLLGFDAKRLRPEGRGELDPVASNATEEGKAKNRRVEIIVQSELKEQVVEDAGLDDKPATVTPGTSPIDRSGSGVDGVKPGLSAGVPGH